MVAKMFNLPLPNFHTVAFFHHHPALQKRSQSMGIHLSGDIVHITCSNDKCDFFRKTQAKNMRALLSRHSA